MTSPVTDIHVDVDSAVEPVIDYKVAAIYVFADISDTEAMKVMIEKECEERNILGGIIIATEGNDFKYFGLFWHLFVTLCRR